MKRRLISAVLAASALTVSVVGVASAKGEPTCSTLFEGYPHGYHVLADYVTGIGSELLGGDGIEWPPSGGLELDGGAAMPGGPYHGGQLPPGASFCIEQASSGGR